MWSLIDRKLQVLIVLVAGGVITMAADWVYGMATGGDPGLFKFVSLAATIIVGVLAFFAERAWKWLAARFPIVQRKTFPDLNGVWEGTLLSSWKKEPSDPPLPAIPTTITIRQGLFSTHVTLKTGESKSYSTRAMLEPVYDIGKFRIWYSYSNHPRDEFRHRSLAHEGVAWLELDFDEDRNRLTGQYFTHRKTTGDIDVTRKPASQ